MPFQEELSQELWRTTKAKLAGLLPAYHRRVEIAVTPKCNSRRKCARKPVHSKSNVPVHTCERRAKREPSLTVGLADSSWMALS
jgi:hypothetical protein